MTLTKRLFDVVVATVLLVASLPVLLLASIAIWCEGRGREPVFFRQARVGLDGHTFGILKFRTMQSNHGGSVVTVHRDPRITSVGRWLRYLKVDELPQLLNIIKGEMSLVGPRPLSPIQANCYQGHERAVFSVRPGLTDWASVYFHREDEVMKDVGCPMTDYVTRVHPAKVALQMAYLDDVSLGTDVRILTETARVLVLSRLFRLSVRPRTPLSPDISVRPGMGPMVDIAAGSPLRERSSPIRMAGPAYPAAPSLLGTQTQLS